MHKLTNLPPEYNFDDPAILRALNLASRALAELKGESKTIPNSDILINTLSLQESKESSEIENIVTTQDDLFKSQIDDGIKNIAAKEVKQYAAALLHGYKLINQHQLLTSNHILEIYTPPQNPQEIIELMSNLEKYINIPELHDVDPLIKMAIIHHQFESIHPFYDGNGRTGRIINILYLVYMQLLDIPVLYLSRYINQNKANYYRLLQTVRVGNNWNEWVIWMLTGVSVTSRQTVELIRQIKQLMNDFQQKIQMDAANIYSKELLDSLFKYPYTKIKFIEDDLAVHRHTARKYLDKLSELGLLSMQKIGKSNYYINHSLFELLSDANK